MFEPDPTKVVNVTIPELRGWLKGYPIQGCKIASLVTRTCPPLTSGHPFPAGVARMAHRTFFIGANYESCVNLQRNREGTGPVEYFNAGPLWKGAGMHVPGEPWLVTHKTKGGLYFAIKPYSVPTENNETGVILPVSEQEWTDLSTNKVLTLAQVQPWLKPISKAVNQDVRHDVSWRTLKIENVLQMRWAGRHFVLKAA